MDVPPTLFSEKNQIIYLAAAEFGNKMRFTHLALA